LPIALASAVTRIIMAGLVVMLAGRVRVARWVTVTFELLMLLFGIGLETLSNAAGWLSLSLRAVPVPNSWTRARHVVALALGLGDGVLGDLGIVPKTNGQKEWFRRELVGMTTRAGAMESVGAPSTRTRSYWILLSLPHRS
jgi:hypothetical protein